MEKNAKIVVSDHAPHHSGRVGYFQFYGTGVSNGAMVLATEPNGNNLFAIASEFVTNSMENEESEDKTLTMEKLRSLEKTRELLKVLQDAVSYLDKEDEALKEYFRKQELRQKMGMKDYLNEYPLEDGE
jgi:hypothetical protein